MLNYNCLHLFCYSAPREPDLDAYDKHYHPKRNSTAKEKRQGFIECIGSGNQSCQVMLAVMKTLDLHVSAGKILLILHG